MRRATALLILALAAATAPAAGPVTIDDPLDRKILSAFCGHAADVPRRMSAEACRKLAADSAEGVCWLALPRAEMPLLAWRLTGEEQYLDAFVETMENLRSAMTTDAEGRPGWYGKALKIFRDPASPDRKVDVLITSFRAVRLLAEFCELTAANPALAAKHADRRAAWQKLAGELIAKWDARGRFVNLGDGGGIYRTREDLRDVKADLTQPHNKHSIILRALLAMHRATGDDAHLRRAVKLATRFKHCLALIDGRYEWNYWDPAGAWDVHPDAAKRWKHWIGREHRSGYYASSLAQAIAMYHHGLVFDRKDVGRFVAHQLAMRWGEESVTPRWRKHSGSYVAAALAPFHQRVHDRLYTGRRQRERAARMDHSWQGGPVAKGYLEGKYLTCPAARGGRAMHADVGKAFLARPANRKLVERLAFEVTGGGYTPPATPDGMNPLPAADGKDAQ